MQKILIIGKNSFLAKNFILYCKKKIKFKAISHKDIKKQNFINYTYIVNFALPLKKYNRKLIDKDNLDLKLAKKIISDKSKAVFVFLSSRKVYKPDKNIKETSKVKPFDIYGKNKLETENKLKQILKSNYLILRISNIIGKINKDKEKSNYNFIDNYFFYKKLKKKIITHNDFKDFISIEDFSKSLFLLINKRAQGVFNISLGRKIYLKDLIYWLDKNFYKNFTFKSKNKKLSFYLNNEKLMRKIKFKPTLFRLKKYIKLELNNVKN